MYVCTGIYAREYAGDLEGQKKVLNPGAIVTGGWKTCECWDMDSGSLEEQHGAISAAQKLNSFLLDYLS